MPTLDLDSLLAPVSADAPAGPNMEYDMDFAALEIAAQGKPERQMGGATLAAEEPDWKAVQKQALALLTKTKDLRIACHLIKALLRTGGLPAFSEGLALLQGLVDIYWDGVYPQLDPDDDNDPTMRVNTIVGLCDSLTVGAVRATPIVSSKLLGRFSMRDVALATGEITAPEGQAAPQMSTIEAALSEVEIEQLQTTTKAVRSGADHVSAIESLITDRVGSSRAPNLSKLSGLLREAYKFLNPRLEQRQAGGDAAAGLAATPAAGAGGNGTSAGAAPAMAGPALSGEIRSRDDVIKALDKICAYYERFEPSSPIPLLVKRCRRLVPMSFLDIMKDMAPEALEKVQIIGGRTEGEA